MNSWQSQPEGKCDLWWCLQPPRTEQYNVSKTGGKQAELVKKKMALSHPELYCLSEEKRPFAAVTFWLLDHDKLGCLCLMRNRAAWPRLSVPGVRDTDAFAPTAARALNFEDHLDY